MIISGINMTKNNEEKNSAFILLDKHAWNYFQLHASQRISLIKLFIILLSAYITASGYLIIRINQSSNIEELSLMFISAIFIAVTVIFFLLDRRNRKLIHIAEDSLRELEKLHLKNTGDDVHQIFIREKYFSDNCCSPRHTSCFSALFLIAIASSLFIYFYAWHHSYQSSYCYSTCTKIEACIPSCQSLSTNADNCAYRSETTAPLSQ